MLTGVEYVLNNCLYHISCREFTPPYRCPVGPSLGLSTFTVHSMIVYGVNYAWNVTCCCYCVLIAVNMRPLRPKSAR